MGCKKVCAVTSEAAVRKPPTRTQVPVHLRYSVSTIQQWAGPSLRRVNAEAEAAARRRGRRKSRSCRSKWSFCLASLGPSVYQPVLTLGKAHEKGCKTRQRMKQNVLSSAGFSGNPIKPVFRSAINPFCLPASLGLHFLSPIHQRMTLNRPPPLPPSIQPSREGGLKSRSSGCFSDAPGESWTGP